MVFLGGAVLGDIMRNKENFWISKKEWMELGVRALDKLGPRGGWFLQSTFFLMVWYLVN